MALDGRLFEHRHVVLAVFGEALPALVMPPRVDPEAGKVEISLRIDRHAQALLELGMVLEQFKKADERFLAERMPGDDVLPGRRAHQLHHAVRRADRSGEQLRLARGAEMVNAGLDQTADVVEVVLLAVVAAVLAPAVAGLTHLRIRIDKAVGVAHRGGRDALDKTVEPPFEHGVALLNHQIGGALDDLVHQAVIPRRPAVRGVQLTAGDVVEVSKRAVLLELVETVRDCRLPPDGQFRRPERVVDFHALERNRSGTRRRHARRGRGIRRDDPQGQNGRRDSGIGRRNSWQFLGLSGFLRRRTPQGSFGKFTKPRPAGLPGSVAAPRRT